MFTRVWSPMKDVPDSLRAPEVLRAPMELLEDWFGQINPSPGAKLKDSKFIFLFCLDSIALNINKTF